MANSEKQKTTSYLSILVRMVVAGVACWFIYKNVDIAELTQTFKRLSVSSIVLAFVVFMGGLCLIALRWWVFMRAQAIRIPLFMAIKLTFLGQFFTNFMPSAVGGDLIRAWYVSRQTHKKLQAALGVAVDRVMGLISTFILGISSYLIVMQGRGDVFQAIRQEGRGIREFLSNIDLSGIPMIPICVFCLGCAFVLVGVFDIRCLMKKIYSQIARLLSHFKEVFGVYVKYPKILIFGLGITIFLQSMVIVTLWLIGRDLGIQAPLEYYFVFFPMMWVIGSLPLSLAGLGIVEGGLVILFVEFTGAERETATALAFCQRLTWILASMPGMAVHLTGAHRTKAPQS